MGSRIESDPDIFKTSIKSREASMDLMNRHTKFVKMSPSNSQFRQDTNERSSTVNNPTRFTFHDMDQQYRPSVNDPNE